MKKYRLTRITVKTRETVSLVKEAEAKIQIPVCPICHSPIPAASLANAESSAAIAHGIEPRPAELSPAKIFDEQD